MSLWWGYKHQSGSFQAKRYSEEWGPREMDDAKDSDFVVEVFGPFQATDRDEALRRIAIETAEIDTGLMAALEMDLPPPIISKKVEQKTLFVVINPKTQEPIKAFTNIKDAKLCAQRRMHVAEMVGKFKVIHKWNPVGGGSGKGKWEGVAQ